MPNQNQTPFVYSGDLEEYSLPQLLIAVWEAKKSGTLHIDAGEIKTWICFEMGFLAGVQIPNSEVYLGMLLRELGFIDDQVFHESLMAVAKTNKKHGQVLLEMGKISQEQLDQGLSLQLTRKLTELFSLHQGRFRFGEEEPIPPQVQPIRIHPYKVIYTGITNRYGEEDLKAQVESFLQDQSCRLLPVFFELHGRFNFPDDEFADLETLKDYRTAEDFIHQTRSGKIRAMMLLVVLKFCNLLEVAEKKAAKPLVQTSPKEASSPNFEERLKVKIQCIKEEDWLKLLEVDAHFDESSLKQAFYRLSREFHPDRYLQVEEELKQVLNFLAAKINQAYQTLSNPISREDYLKSISQPDPAANEEDQGKPKEDPDRAMVEYEKAKVFINKKDYASAVEQLELAHRLDPKKAEYQIRLLWFGFQLSGLGDRDRLLDLNNRLQDLFRDFPGNYYINRYLASVQRLLRNESEYEKHLKKAHSIRPTDIETAREMRLLESRKKKGADPKSLFGIKIKK